MEKQCRKIRINLKLKKKKKRLCWWLSWWRICLQCRRSQFNSWVRKILWRRHRLPTPVYGGFPGGSDDKESTCNVGDLGSVPGLGKSPGEGNGLPTQYSCFLPGELSEQRSLTDYSPWGYKESGEKVQVSLSK